MKLEIKKTSPCIYIVNGKRYDSRRSARGRAVAGMGLRAVIQQFLEDAGFGCALADRLYLRLANDIANPAFNALRAASAMHIILDTGTGYVWTNQGLFIQRGKVSAQ